MVKTGDEGIQNGFQDSKPLSSLAVLCGGAPHSTRGDAIVAKQLI